MRGGGRNRRMPWFGRNGIVHGVLLLFAVSMGLVQWLRGDEAKGEELRGPTDVVVTGAGQVLVADPASHRVYLLEDDGGLAVAVGSGTDGVAAIDAPAGARPSGDARIVDLGEPVALAERDGSVFVADRELGAVLRLSEGSVEPLPGPWASPKMVAATRDDGVYAGLGPGTDGRLTRVVESEGLDGGSPEEVVLPGPSSKPDEVIGLGESPAGQLLVWIDDDGLYLGDERIVNAAGDGSRRPTDIAVGHSGDVAVVERDARTVTVFRPDGGVRREVEVPWTPRAVALGEDGTLIVLRESDPDGTFVYRIERDDTITPIGPGSNRRDASDRL